MDDLPHISLVQQTSPVRSGLINFKLYPALPFLALPCLETVACSNSEPDENTTRALALILPDTKFE